MALSCIDSKRVIKGTMELAQEHLPNTAEKNKSGILDMAENLVGYSCIKC
jgi:hypothetical protein